MPSRITPPTLPEATYHYLGLFGVRARQSDFERAEKLFHQALGRVRRPEDIRARLRWTRDVCCRYSSKARCMNG